MNETARRLTAVYLSALMVFSVFATVTFVGPAAAASVTAAVNVADSSPGASTNHNWTTTVGSDKNGFAAIKLNYTNAQTDVSNLDGNAGSVTVTVAGSPASVSNVSANSDAANINFGPTNVSAGDKVVVNITDDLIGNPSNSGTYTGKIELFAGSSPFQTTDADFSIGFPAAPYVNNSDRTHDPSTNTTLSVDYNATGEMSSSDAGVEVLDSQSTTLGINNSLSAVGTEGTATLTITGGTLSGDEQVTYQLLNTSAAIVNATDSSWLNDTGGGGDTTAPSISSANLSESSGNMDISFNSTNEQLGGSASDVTVEGSGPNGATYTFDRTDFSESGSGPYTYTLATQQAYDDGDGFYGVNITVAKDSAGNNGGTTGEGSGLTDSYQFSSSTDTWVNGTVTNQSGAAIEGATAVANPESGGTPITATTDSNGDYSLEVNPGTNYEIIIDNEPDNPFEVKPGVSVSNGNTKTHDFQLKEFPDKGFINGTVLDSDGNTVGQGVPVSARDLGYRFSGSTTTDSNGKFSIQLPAADYLVRAKGSNSPPQTREGVTVNEGETTQITLQLPQTGYITGTVTNSSGKVGGVGVVADSGDQVVFDRTNISIQPDTGKYNITAPPGDYTVSVFARGQDASSQQVTVTGGSTTTADFTLEKTKILHSSVEKISGSGDASNIGINAEIQRGMIQAKLTNESGGGGPGGVGGPPDELDGLGVTDSTEFRMNITVTNFSASSLMWGVDDASWTTSQNDTNADATDITVTGTPVQLQVKFDKKGSGAETGVGPLMFKDPSEVSWATGRDDQATAGRNKTVYFGVFDLSNMPGTVRNNLKGMSVTTNAQRFSTPNVVNNSLRVWVAAPTKTVAGSDHTGFYQAEIPQAQLDEWGVTDPESELTALYKGDSANFAVTDTDSGARILLENISYSAGFAEVEAAPETGGDTGNDNSGSTSSGGGGGGVVATGSTVVLDPTSDDVTTQVTESGTTATVAQVPTDDTRISFDVTGANTDQISVLDATADIATAVSGESTMSVTASTAQPSGTPTPPGDQILSYVTVDIQGAMASSVTSGSFTIDLAGSDVDPDEVTAHRYDGTEWEAVDVQPQGDGSVKVTSENGFSPFVIGASETSDPGTPTESGADTQTPSSSDSAEPTAETDTPAETIEITTSEPTPTQTPAQTPGSSGPGFSLALAALALALTVVLARLRR